jgi:hypothetical protein
MVNVTCKISHLFKAISILRGTQFPIETLVNVESEKISIDTPSGIQPIKSLIRKEAKLVKVEFDNGLILKCADTHKLISEHEEEIFAKDSIGRKIISKNSNLNVTKVTQLEEIGEVFDLEVNHPLHVYYTADGILHHNTSMCAALSLVLYLNGLQTLLIVPSTDLVKQTVDEFKHHLSAYPVGIGEYSGSKKDIDNPIVVATWQSLQNVPEYMKYFNAVIVDEAHGAKATVIRDLINVHGKHISHRYGCTGTFPKGKCDQYALKLSIGTILKEIPARWLIEQGYLSEIEIEPVETVDEDPDLPDYASERAYLTHHDDRNEALAAAIMEYRDKYGNTMVLVNTQSLAQGRAIANLIPGSVYLDGSSKSELRQEQYKQYADRDDMIVIASAGIASTGISIDRIFCLILLDPGKSFVKCIQAVGRGLRKKGDKFKVFVVDMYSKLKYGKKHWKERQGFYKEAGYPMLKVKKLKY